MKTAVTFRHMHGASSSGWQRCNLYLDEDGNAQAALSVDGRDVTVDSGPRAGARRFCASKHGIDMFDALDQAVAELESEIKSASKQRDQLTPRPARARPAGLSGLSGE